MDDKFIYIPIDDKQNQTLCRFYYLLHSLDTLYINRIYLAAAELGWIGVLFSSSSLSKSTNSTLDFVELLAYSLDGVML